MPLRIPAGRSAAAAVVEKKPPSSLNAMPSRMAVVMTVSAALDSASVRVNAMIAANFFGGPIVTVVRTGCMAGIALPSATQLASLALGATVRAGIANEANPLK